MQTIKTPETPLRASFRCMFQFMYCHSFYVLHLIHFSNPPTMSSQLILQLLLVLHKRIMLFFFKEHIILSDKATSCLWLCGTLCRIQAGENYFANSGNLKLCHSSQIFDKSSKIYKRIH